MMCIKVPAYRVFFKNLEPRLTFFFSEVLLEVLEILLEVFNSGFSNALEDFAAALFRR